MRRFVILLLLGAVCGCQSVAHHPGIPDVSNAVPVKKSADRLTRNNAASLLYDLLNNEKNISRVLIIKSASPELSQLIKRISDASADGVKTLDALAAADHHLKLDRTGLPPGDAAARAASSKSSQHVILHSSGPDFEFQLLLTQVQAMDYATQIARVAAASEADPDHAREFSALGNQFASLYELVIDQLRKH